MPRLKALLWFRTREVHLPSWHRDHFLRKKCKDAPAYAVIRMKRTQCFYTYRVYKGGTANNKPRPLPGMGFFCLLVPVTLCTITVLVMVPDTNLTGYE